MTDRELWLKMKSGDRTAFEAVYRAHISALSRYGRRFSPDSELIVDCVHDLFVDLWNKREQIGETNSIRPYLLVSLRRLILKKVDQNERFSDKQPEDCAFELELSIEELIAAGENDRENAIALKKAFEGLSDRQKEAIYLKYYEKMEYEDICKAMQINYQSARNLIFNGIKKMRELIVSTALWLLFFLFE